jgi:peptidylprolyl isomerase
LLRRRALTSALAAAAVPALLLTACGGGSSSSTNGTASSPTASSSPSTGASSAPSGGAAPSTPSDADLAAAVSKFLKENSTASTSANTPAVTGEPGKEPTIAKGTSPAPDKIVIKDLALGNGAPAKLSSTVTIDYKGVTYEDAKTFDQSYGKAPATFPLAQLIDCWKAGVPGMKEGGRRELVCPPQYAYGPAGSGSPLAGKTLTFVIDLKKVA